jgi:hypothetical protein
MRGSMTRLGRQPQISGREQPENYGRLIFKENGDSDVAGMLPPLGVLQVKKVIEE